MSNWSLYQPCMDIRDFTKRITSTLSEIGSEIPREVKDSMREVLELGRGSGRITKHNFNSGAQGLVLNFEQGYKEEIKERVREFGLEGKQAKLFFDIASMTFNFGYQNPYQEKQPRFYDSILELLDN